MEKETIISGNHSFFLVAVGMSLCDQLCDQAFLSSLFGEGTAQHGIERGDYSGYLRINTTDIITNGRNCDLANEVKEGNLLGKLASKLLASEKKGELSDEAEVNMEGYRFRFKITNYERDREHDFQIVEDLSLLPEEEVIGRFVELKVTIA
jgi:hypothetical protein